jgi:hypothetical protein
MSQLRAETEVEERQARMHSPATTYPNLHSDEAVERVNLLLDKRF